MTDIKEFISNAVEKALNDDDFINKALQESIQRLVKDTIEKMFSWGEARTVFEEKMNELMVPAIKAHDFTDYVNRLDITLSSMIQDPAIIANNKILSNFKAIMGSPDDKKTITIPEILKLYGDYVAKNIDTDGRDISDDWEDGPQYVDAICEVDVESNKSCYRTSDNYESYLVCLHAEDEKDDKGEEMCFEFEMYRWKWNQENLYNVIVKVDPKSLRFMSVFEAHLYSLMVSNIMVEWDRTEDHYEIEVTPKDTPEPTFS